MNRLRDFYLVMSKALGGKEEEKKKDIVDFVVA
jgi:hypothetical protein